MRSTEASVKLVCFSGCWVMACIILLCLGRKLPPCVYTAVHFVGQGRSATTLALHAEYCSSASNLVSISGWFFYCSLPGAPRGSSHFCCFQFVPKSHCSYLQIISFFFLNPTKEIKTLSSDGSAKCKRCLCCSTGV